MNNVLKISLLVIGIGLLGFGLFTLISPETSLETGPITVEAQGDNTQSYAMMGFGLLALIAGMAFGKR